MFDCRIVIDVLCVRILNIFLLSLINITDVNLIHQCLTTQRLGKTLFKYYLSIVLRFTRSDQHKNVEFNYHSC